MKKFTVALVVIGAFIFYSLLHAQSGGAVLGAKSAVDAGPPTTTSVPTVAGSNPNESRVPARVASGAPPAAADDDPPPTASVPTPTPTSAAAVGSGAPRRTGSSQSGPTATAAMGSAALKDGTYTGPSVNAQWGYVQVQAVISGGKITDVQFLDYPNDRSRSVRINQYADPQLRDEAIQTQSAQVDIVTSATDSSEAFMRSLATALQQASA